MAAQPAWALRVEVRPDPLPLGFVEEYVIGTVIVDGLPVFKTGLRVWDGMRWVSIPETHQGERPIPRRQRRME